MPDPLIDRDRLATLMDEVTEQIALGNRYVTHADSAISYLRKVLTPEALTPVKMVPTGDGLVSRYWATGDDLHRRIFGEDQ